VLCPSGNFVDFAGNFPLLQRDLAHSRFPRSLLKSTASVRETAMTNRTRDPRPAASSAELSADQLAQVSGGHAIVSPRDAASGLPTGKRMHKPFVSA
jgi:hypothetical protein